MLNDTPGGVNELHAPGDPGQYAFRQALSRTGSERIRVPVAANIALVNAGITGGNTGSPSPVGGLSGCAGRRGPATAG